LMNGAMLRAAGYELREVFGRDFLTTFVPEQERTRLVALFEELRASPPPLAVESPILTSDGQALTVEWRGRAQFDADGELESFAAVGIDRTEERRAQAQLAEREQQYREIFEATGDGLIVNDLETGRVVAANPAACEMHGYTCDELVGLTPMAYTHPEDRRIIGEYLDAVRRGERFRGQARHLRKDGTTLEVALHGSRFVYHGRPHGLSVIRDVTPQAQARQLLEQHVAERTRELTTLLVISHNVASTLELRPLLRLILDQVRDVIPYTGASILLLEDKWMTLLDGVSTVADAEVLRGLRFPVASAPAIWDQLLAREPIIVDDVRGDSVLARSYRAAVGEHLYRPPLSVIRAWLAVPLALKDRLIGMMTVSHREPGYFETRHARLIKAVASQAAVAIENARLYEQARAFAALQERQRLARELHDSVSQALYGIALGARTARTLLDRDPDRAGEPLDYVLSLAEAGLAEMRALILELRPESLASEGLVGALARQAAALRARHKLEVEEQIGVEPEVPLPTKEALYRVAQEALNNVVKHARASRACLALSTEGDVVVLRVSDDGKGFDPGGSFPGHLGLQSMRERIAQLGGHLTIESVAGEGTTVRAVVPATGTPE
ncbi:MAG: PAS domain S-box protein, partial [Chloroflexota bacterium]|nr:PAS domain S-box protein [Chloroflexota bacterium]